MGRQRRYDPRRPLYEGNGFILINKPEQMTSFGVVRHIRKRFNIKKIGHCGTLDPAATGLLVVVFGKFTKLSQRLSGVDKAYEARILLGIETHSHDLDGDVLAENDYSAITEEQLRDAIMAYEGDIEQVPPMVSALKKNGKKLCNLARKGIVVEREARPVTVHALNVQDVNLPYADFSVMCSKGTYIRSLAHDIGQDLGCGAVLAALHRTQCGVFDIADSVSMETVNSWNKDVFRAHTESLYEANEEFFNKLSEEQS